MPDARASELVRDRLSRLRLLDPACGSGAFLVHALERIAGALTALGERDELLAGLLGFIIARRAGVVTRVTADEIIVDAGTDGAAPADQPLARLHQQSLDCGLTDRADAIEMRKKEPDWAFMPVRY